MSSVAVLKMKVVRPEGKSDVLDLLGCLTSASVPAGCTAVVATVKENSFDMMWRGYLSSLLPLVNPSLVAIKMGTIVTQLLV